MNKIREFYAKYAFPINVFLMWRGVVLFFQIFMQPQHGINSRSSTVYDRLYLSWNTYWDGGHYLAIANRGYEYPLQNFFPLWPMMIKFVGFIFQNVYLASYVLTFILGMVTCILLYRVGKTILSEEQNRIALLLFLTYPGTIFLHAGYTESPFLVLALLTFLFIEQKRYLLAAIVGSWTSATRLVGIIMPALFLALNIPLKKKIILMALSTSGFLTYCAYLFFTTGNPLYFKEAQKHWCEINNNCTPTFPVVTLVNEYNELPPLYTSIGYESLDWIVSLLFLTISLLLFKKLPYQLAIYAFLTIVFPLATGSTVSMTRYALLAFPIFYGLPLLIKNKYVLATIMIIFALLHLQAVTDFTNFKWVALIQTLHAYI